MNNKDKPKRNYYNNYNKFNKCNYQNINNNISNNNNNISNDLIEDEENNIVNNSIFSNLTNKNNLDDIDQNKNNLNNKEVDQALSLNDKFIYKNIELDNSKNNNNYLCYIPEENIQGLFSINIQPLNNTIKLNYLKHCSLLGNKRNNNDNIYQNFENNNINNEQNKLENNYIDNIFKTIFKNRKNFYGNNEIKKNIDKEFYVKYINDITNKDKLLSNNNQKIDIQNYNDYIYKNYKSMEKLSLSNISCCYLKERNIKNNSYYSQKNIIINSLFFLINEKINEMTQTHGKEIMFVGESGIGKSYSLYLYTYILRLNPFNLVISIFEIDEFIENPCLYLQKEIAYSLYYACFNNAEIDFKDLYDCLIIDKNNKKMNYDILLDKLKYLMSVLFEAYDNKLSLYVIIDGFEKADKGKELIDKLINCLYNVNLNLDGTENKEFEERFKVIYFCNSDESNSDYIIKEKFKDFSKNEFFTQVNYSNFFEQGIIFLEPELIYDKREMIYFIDKNIINKEYINNNDDEDKIIKNILDYSNYNFKKILWLIRDNKILSKIKESKSVQYYINDNLEDWLYNKIFQFDKLSFEDEVRIYHFIYSCQNLKDMSENLTVSFFIKGYKAFNYSLIIPQILKNNDTFSISFKLKNKNLTILLKYLNMDKLYKKINLNNVSLDCLIKEYSETKSAILRGLIIEEMIFVIFQKALKENPKIKLNFNVLKYAKLNEYLSGEFLEKSNQISIIISNVEKSMSREDDIFEKQNFFTNEINEDTDGIYFLSHRFPCIDCVIKNGKDLYLIQIKKTLMFEHILQLNEDMHYFYLLLSNDNIYNELVRQNELKLSKKKNNTKLNFFIKLAKLYKQKFNYNFNFMFVYQAKESSLDINKNTDEINIKNKYESEKREITYKLDDKWRGPIDREQRLFSINNDYFLNIKCSQVLHNILLTTIDNFTADIQKILRINKNQNFFSSLKE